MWWIDGNCDAPFIMTSCGVHNGIITSTYSTSNAGCLIGRTLFSFNLSDCYCHNNVSVVVTGGQYCGFIGNIYNLQVLLIFPIYIQDQILHVLVH